jgi:hypothetical protein
VHGFAGRGLATRPPGVLVISRRTLVKGWARSGPPGRGEGPDRAAHRVDLRERFRPPERRSTSRARHAAMSGQLSETTRLSNIAPPTSAAPRHSKPPCRTRVRRDARAWDHSRLGTVAIPTTNCQESQLTLLTIVPKVLPERSLASKLTSSSCIAAESTRSPRSQNCPSFSRAAAARRRLAFLYVLIES